MSADLSSMMAEDAAAQFRAPTNEEIQQVADLAREQLGLEQLLADQQAEVLETSKKLATIREVTIPSSLEKFGVLEMKMLDGSMISIKEEVYTGITEENRDPAFKWLEETGNDGIIKNEVKCPFGKGQDVAAKALLDILNDKGYSYTNHRNVHPQTLKAFVKKRLEAGEPIPTDIFSIHVKKVASIKQPKVKK